MNENKILNILRSVNDPEIGINIVDLGLVYNVAIENDSIHVELTMTTPTCPLGDLILRDASLMLESAFPQAKDIQLELVWDPPWTPERMSPAAKQQLGWS